MAANNLQGQEHRIVSSEITRVKANIRTQLHEADRHRINNCVDQLFGDQPKVPPIIAIIPQFLAGDSAAIQAVVEECQKNWRLRELKKIETFLLGLQQVSFFFLSFQLKMFLIVVDITAR